MRHSSTRAFAIASMAAVFDAWDRLHTYSTVDDVLDHFGISTQVWQAFEAQVGSPGADLRLLAALPRTAVVTGCGQAVTPNGNLSPMEATSIGLVWRMARRILASTSGVRESEFVDIDPWQETNGDIGARVPTVGTDSTTVTPTGSGVKERVLKMASLIDVSDESELLPPKASMIDAWHQNYLVLMGSSPDDTEEPTASQLAALHKKIYIENRAPYTDFSVWTPFERRMSRVQKCRVYTPLGNGSYLQQDLPGPSSFSAWKTNWAVFRTAALMLNICSIASLEAYYRQIEKLSTQWPSAWGLIYTADDTARAEKLDKIRRRITLEASRGRQVPLDWDETRPWSCVFHQLANDVTYWTERVHHPAAAWVAAGARGAPVVATEAAVLNMIPGGNKALTVEKESHQDVNSASKQTLSNRERRQNKKRKQQADREELSRFRSSAASSGQGGKGQSQPKGKGKGKSKDQAGQEICFSWASGKGPCAEVPPGGECKCPVKRIHKCRFCLSPTHRDEQCSQKA